MVRGPRQPTVGRALLVAGFLIPVYSSQSVWGLNLLAMMPIGVFVLPVTVALGVACAAPALGAS